MMLPAYLNVIQGSMASFFTINSYCAIINSVFLLFKCLQTAENCGCKNGGTCKDVVDDVESSAEVLATCNCLKGYTGEFCEKEETEAEKAGKTIFIIANKT